MGTVTYTLDADTGKAVDAFLKVVEAWEKTGRQLKKPQGPRESRPKRMRKAKRM